MGWDSATKARILSASSLPLDVALRVSRNAAGTGVGGDYLCASDRRLQPGCYLDPATLNIQGAGVSVPDFRYRAGGFSVEVNLPERLGNSGAGGSAFAPSVRRGSICELLIGFGSGELSDYIPYKLGIISAVKILSTDRARIEVYDIVYALRSRPSPDLSSGDPQTRLFEGLAGTETTLSALYTAGDSTITLTDETNFETFDGTGVAKVSGNSGSTFYVKFTGVNAGANQLTGVTAPHFGTTDESAASGNAAVSTAYINTHPITAIWRLLVSTGAGTNGSQDKYPVSAGFGLDQSWLDLHSFREWTSDVVKAASGSYLTDILIEEPVEDGLHYIGALFAELGLWIVQSEGQIAVRAAQDPSSPVIVHTSPITDDLLLEFPAVDLYDPQVPFAYNRVEVQSLSLATGTNKDATVLPLRDTLTYDVSSFIISNEGAVRTEARDRMDDFGLYVPERISILIRGAFWGFAPGDYVRMTSGLVRSRFRSCHEGIEDRALFVANVSEDPIGGSTALELLSYPLDLSDDYG